MRLRNLLAAASCALAAVPMFSQAHHAFGGFFDMGTITEIEGGVTENAVRKPHVRFFVRADGGNTWQIETDSVSIPRRLGTTPELVGVWARGRCAGGWA